MKTAFTVRPAGPRLLRSPAAFLLPILLCVCAIFLWQVPAGRAHYDPPGPPALEDFIRITEIIAETDQDDGANGESEYILHITFKHPGHAEANSVIVTEVVVNWDDTDPATGRPYDEGNPLRLPLVGKDGYISDAINSLIHQECSPSAPWEVTIELRESNNLVLADILKILGQAASKLGTNLPPVDPRVNGGLILGGALAEALGDVLAKLFNNMENLGQSNPNWNSGDGEAGNTNTNRSGDLAHFSYKAEKHVKVIPGNNHFCESTNTPSVGEIPEHSFGDDFDKAQHSWDYLIQAAGMIDTVSIEPGTPNGPLEQAQTQDRQQTLRELIGGIGRSVAHVEMNEARDHPELVPPEQLAQAQQLFAMGENFRQQSLSQSNTPALLQALQLYRQVFSSLAHNLHKTQTSPLHAYLSGGDIVFHWQHGGVLQYADSITDDEWVDIPMAISGYRVVVSASNRFFRVIKR